ncbi:MAG TPA: neutral/alkaline non-lysosomal ceramidase N-terminal domain-containing protein [Gemmataceae bacterium]|nr:neutral/alkaline non-lysosomal ceramidase N-terminal domain-containing protein [Gemmataceae bacterium]
MTTRITTPQTRCKVGFAQADVTPPVGIYHRMWGAALHDRATGVHRRLTATAMWLDSIDGGEPLVVIGVDHCILDRAEFEGIIRAVSAAARVEPNNVLIALSHTHGSAWMSRSRSHLPGGDLIGPYLDELRVKCAELACDAASGGRAATIVYGTGRCSLARHRDYWDEESRQFVCGFNPSGPADDTVVVAKVIDDDGATLGTVVNYACHPTTLAWQNTLISPDYVGSMREVVERETGAPCLFLQGASGDLGPRDGYVGAVAVADRNGRQLGFAALSAIEELPPPGTRCDYSGPVVSGAVLGTWAHVPADAPTEWVGKAFTVELPYRADLPKADETRAELARWEAAEAEARTKNVTLRVSECRARAEQMTRQLARLAVLPTGAVFLFAVTVRRLGSAVWVFTPGELYHVFQTTVRARFPDLAVVVTTLTNDWQPGYVPAAASYGHGIYQEIIAAVAPGSLETLTDAVCREVAQLCGR